MRSYVLKFTLRRNRTMDKNMYFIEARVMCLAQKESFLLDMIAKCGEVMDTAFHGYRN